MSSRVRREHVDAFLSQRTLALVGASRSGRGFGTVALRELVSKGYAVYPVHPEADEVAGEPCWRSLADLPESVGGVVIVVPPRQTLGVLEDVRAAGIPRVWMQQGAESEEAIAFCARNGIDAVHGECILMFAEPTGFVHRAHRGLWKILHKLPA